MGRALEIDRFIVLSLLRIFASAICVRAHADTLNAQRKQQRSGHLLRQLWELMPEGIPCSRLALLFLISG